MHQYISVAKQILASGKEHKNRTETDTIRIYGVSLKFNMDDGFPLLTTKEMAWKSAFAEMIGFIRGYDSAANFRKIGCNVWDKNANDPGKNGSNKWLRNPFRKCQDDIGRMYGVQARNYRTYKVFKKTPVFTPPDNNLYFKGQSIDQLGSVYDKLLRGKDDRRLIVTHLNPAEVDQGCLWPCHMFYKFTLEGTRLNLTVYLRSNDWPLGAPYNIAQYAFLLHLFAHITGYEPGILWYLADDAHIYKDQIIGMEKQVDREPLTLPSIKINDRIKTLSDVEESFEIHKDVWIRNYQSHGKIKFPFST